MRCSKRDLGGEGQSWSLILSVDSYGISEYPGGGRLQVVQFRAETIDQAQLKVLQASQDLIRKACWSRETYFYANAAPSEATESGSPCLIRIKRRFANRRLLRVKNPNKVMVMGYGPKALRELEN